MIPYATPELFSQDSVEKQLVISFTGGSFTNSDIETESFEWNDPMCSAEQLEFGECCAASVKFNIGIDSVPMQGKELTITITPSGGTAVALGKFKVWSDVPTADRRWRTIEAYDAMADILNTECVSWYDGLFPVGAETYTVKQFRDSFFTFLGITQETVTLINDSETVAKTISTTSLSGKDVITSICQMNAVFGKIARDGKFKYVDLVTFGETLYPAEDLYPADDLYPAENTNVTELGANGTYLSCEYEDYVTDFIDKVQIREQENDIGVIVGSGTNAFIIENNFLLFGKGSLVLNPIATAIYNHISGIYFKPAKMVTVGNPLMETGDGIRLWTKYAMIDTYILNRKMTGIQSLRDSIEAKSTKERSEQLNDTHHELIQLMGKSNTLTRTIEETVSTVEHIIDPLDPTSLQSQITQNAQAITLKVSKGEVISSINQSAEAVTIDASKINLNGAVTANNNFKINLDGTMETIGATITGDITSQNVEGAPEYVQDEAVMSSGAIEFSERLVTGREDSYPYAETEHTLLPRLQVSPEEIKFLCYPNIADYLYADTRYVYDKNNPFTSKIYTESHYETSLSGRPDITEMMIETDRVMKFKLDSKDLLTLSTWFINNKAEYDAGTGYKYESFYAVVGEGNTGSSNYNYIEMHANGKLDGSGYGAAYLGDTTGYTTGSWSIYGYVYHPSDRRFKKDIEEVNEALIRAMSKVQLKQFFMTIGDRADKTTLGAIAQEVKDALAEEGLDYKDFYIVTGDEETCFGMDYEQFLIAKCAYLEDKVSKLEERIARLEEIMEGDNK